MKNGRIVSPSKPAQSSPTPSGLDVANGTGNAHRGLDSLSPGATMRPRRSVDELNRGRATSPSKVTTASCSTPKRSMTGPSLAPDTPVTPSAPSHQRRVQLRSPWACSILTLVTTICAFALGIMIIFAFTGRQLDPKGAAMSYMRPKFVSFAGFDTEHTRFAGKYSLFLYRERGIDDDERVKGIPVLFVPGNAGSYKQVRPFAAEAAVHYQQSLQVGGRSAKSGIQPLDVFSVDFNEDITAFHGQTMLDQAEYLNEAVAYILSLYTTPGRSLRDAHLPDPSSVMLLGHSMGGIVARTMLILPNYRPNTVNTIITLAAPHARAPISFDSDIVSNYKRVNDFWRESYFAPNESQNPLANLALISIAGGGLDTIVPSDYSTIASLVPPSHGFTVFTTTMPQVWTGMDHLAICWCDQLRKSLVQGFYDVADAGRPDQTKPLAERLRLLERRFLSGLEDAVTKSVPAQEPDTLLTLEDNSNAIISQGKRLVLRSLGDDGKQKAHLLPIPPQGSPDRKQFTLLTDHGISSLQSSNAIDVLFCSVFPLQSGKTGISLSKVFDLSGDTSGSTRLACRNAAADVVLLPASTEESKYPFDGRPPMSYLQYDLDSLSDSQFVAVIDHSQGPTSGWLIAEFSTQTDATLEATSDLREVVRNGLDMSLRADRPLISTIHIPSVFSSLLAYKLEFRKRKYRPDTIPELFAPLLRQYIAEPYESKYFVNVEKADISMHGVAPYLPPPLNGKGLAQGLRLQFWSDPTSNVTAEVSLRVDLLGSMGKLWMRYRTVLAAFPLLVVALVLRKQFQLYDATGVFMSFSESMDQCLRRSIPALVVALTFMAMSNSRASQTMLSSGILRWANGASSHDTIDFAVNDLVLGSQDPFFWFLVPLFGLISVGICIALNYAVLIFTHISSLIYMACLKWSSKDGRLTNSFADTSLRKRLITTSVMLLLASTIIPYQFVFVILCLVQISTCVKVLSIALDTHAGENMNFYNYTHSILMLMLWILPLSIPVLVVWIRNLSIHWLTAFSSHQNVFSILPLVLLVEILSTGKMVPRVTSWIRHSSSTMLFCLAVYAGVYGVTYAYCLHWLVILICLWLVLLHATSKGSNAPLRRLMKIMRGDQGNRWDVKKRP